MSKMLKISAVAGVLALLSACGDTDLERTATGAVIGGAAAHVTGEDVAGGALIGGAIGATSCTLLGNC